MRSTVSFEKKWHKAKKNPKFVSSRPRAFRFALKICAFHFFSYIENKKIHKKSTTYWFQKKLLEKISQFSTTKRTNKFGRVSFYLTWRSHAYVGASMKLGSLIWRTFAVMPACHQTRCIFSVCSSDIYCPNLKISANRLCQNSSKCY